MKINCFRCADKGFVEVSRMGEGRAYSTIAMCPKCNNVMGYSAEIKRRLGAETIQETPQQKIDRLCRPEMETEYDNV